MSIYVYIQLLFLENLFRPFPKFTILVFLNTQHLDQYHMTWTAHIIQHYANVSFVTFPIRLLLIFPHVLWNFCSFLFISCSLLVLKYLEILTKTFKFSTALFLTWWFPLKYTTLVFYFLINYKDTDLNKCFGNFNTYWT